MVVDVVAAGLAPLEEGRGTGDSLPTLIRSTSLSSVRRGAGGGGGGGGEGGSD